MKQTVRSLAFTLALLLPGVAAAQCSASLPPNTVMGRLGISPGPCQAIPFSRLGQAGLLGNAFTQFAGPAAPTKTFTLPNVSGTIALLNQAQTWTAAQTFFSSLSANGGLTLNSNPVVSATGSLVSGNLASFNGTAGLLQDSGVPPPNSRLAKTAAYTVANADKFKTIALGGAVAYNLTFGAASGYDANFSVNVLNEDTFSKTIVLNGRGNYTLNPGQSAKVFAQNNVWYVSADLPSVSVKDFGAKADFVQITATVSISSGSAALTATGANFLAADVGKSIIVNGAGAAGAPLVSAIQTFTDATHVGLSSTSSTALTASSQAVGYGTDDHNAIQAAVNYSQNQQIGFQPTLPVFGEFIQATPVILFPPGNYYNSDSIINWLALRIKAYGAVFSAPPTFTTGISYFQASCTNPSTGPFYGRQFYMDGGTFNAMSSHIYIYNCNVGGGKIELHDTELFGALNNSLTFQAESSTIDLYNIYSIQNARALQVVNRTHGAVSQTTIHGGTIVPRAFTTSGNFTIFMDGCGTVTACTLGTGTQPSSDILDIEEVVWIAEPSSGNVVDPAYVQWNDGGMLYVRNNRFSQEAGGVAVVNANTKWRVANLSTSPNPPAEIVMQNNYLYADPNLINDSNAGIRLFQVPNKIEFTNNYGHAVTGPVLAPGTGVNLATALSGAGTPNVNVTFWGNQFANDVTTNEFSLIPTQLRPYLVPVNFGVVNTTAGYNIYGSTSGVVAQTAPAVAGNPLVTWGNGTGTPAVTASAPLAINTTTGNISCSTCVPTGALSTWTPTITPGGGTLTGATVAALGSYQQSGKIVNWTVTVTITALGSGSPASAINLTLPVGTAVRGAAGACYEANITGNSGAARILPAGSTMALWYYNNTTMWAAGVSVVCSGWYEAT